ncbi:HTH-type transcriptional regulator GltC [Paenibacillus polymyxa E681]|uniref:LysR family transcriptional regulator n=1 Tax=Paenibacillus polymyxa TaxID=1406 RepID=UPI0001E3176D|nr:LysR family transcriptional regulator [Paenibacillus polymyxa]ADM68745.1 LysR family transcriptional regulator [Paenibacillus polymyxa E681]QNV55748.1 HTH-type transcriptional regulator GltC [Paenibacillus polymyxa E681]QNV60584.1 HTH-type transcriptional regulator GltC [Paenibacillus polymyxa E681]
MNLKHLQYFRVLAEMEHFTQAAVRLCITQPSLSHAISELEKDLGVHLFEKQGRNIRLNKYGRFFLKYVEHAMDELEKGEHNLRELVSPSHGNIDLAFIYTLGSHFIPAIIQAFSALDAHKDISFSFHQGNTNDIIQGLKQEHYDVAFCSHMENEPNVEFIPLAQQELVVIVSPDHPLAILDQIDLKDTADYPVIFFNKKSGVRPIIENLFAKAGVTPQIICEIEEDTAMAGLVSVNYGIGVMPRISSLDYFNVKTLPIVNPEYERFIYLACIKNRYLSPAVVDFRNFALSYGKEFYLKTHQSV